MDQALAAQRSYDYSDYLENYYIGLLNDRRRDSLKREGGSSLEVETILMLPSPQKERAFIRWCLESL